MASRRRFAVSRSVVLSLAALLVLTGAMFMVTTFQQDSEEWVLVEDQVFDDLGVLASPNSVGSASNAPEYEFVFDDESSTYTYEVTGGTKDSSVKWQGYAFAPVEGFDFSKEYKIVLSSELVYDSLYYLSGTSYVKIFDLSTISVEDGVYSGSIVLLDQLVTDLSYKDCAYVQVADSAANTTAYGANTFTFQVYELQTDNTGSVAAGVTGLVLIVMGVFSMPMHNILRRR